MPCLSPPRPGPFLRAVLLAALVLAFAAPAAGAATPLFGFNDGSVPYGQLSATASAQLAKNAGSTADNIVLSWRDAQPAPGTLNLSTYDAIYNARIAKGIKPIFTIVYAPRWTWASDVNCSGDCRYPPSAAHDADWKAFVTTVAKRYPKLAAIQVWNEPNIPAFWQSAIDPERYTQMVKLANAAVKSVTTTIPVLAGALANGAPNGIDNRTYLQRMYAAGLKGNYGGLSIHDYPYDIDPWQFYGTLSDTREIRDAAGDKTMKIWVTEFGVTTTNPLDHNYAFNENDQAATLGRLLQKLRTMPDIAATIVHTLVEPTIFAPDHSEYGFGVVHPQPDLVPKPAYCELARINATGYTCPAIAAKAVSSDSTQNLRWVAEDLVQAAADGARAYRAKTGSYYGLTPAILRTYAPQISATAGSSSALPGPSADPSRMVIWAPTTGPNADLWLCNTSKADRSYCIWLTPDRAWTYGQATGPVSDASRATAGGVHWW